MIDELESIAQSLGDVAREICGSNRMQLNDQIERLLRLAREERKRIQPAPISSPRDRQRRGRGSAVLAGGKG